VRDDCSQRLDELERAQPTVIFSVSDAAGNDVIVVKVSVDGKVLAEKLDGAALQVDPGAHEFTFEVAGQPPVKKTILIREQEKGRTERIALGAAQSPGSTPAPGETPSETKASSGSPWHTAGWVVGGVGVAGLGVGAVFGLMAMSKKNDAECAPSGACNNFGSVSDAKSDATIANVGLIAGGVLVAGGAALLLFTGSGSPSPQGGTPAAAVSATPFVGPGGGGLALEGTW
jgi:hypothetical protein